MTDNNVENSEPTSERLRDFYRNPSYERRVVIFYDVLGWRSHIAAAGNNVEKIGKLATPNSTIRSIIAASTHP